jgi:membrane protease YdiL (CAAX protease family)
MNRFALRRPSAKYVVIAIILGLWIAVFVQFVHPGRLSNLRFQTSLGLGTLALLVAPLFEEAMVRGFFYPTFRNVFGVPLSIAFVLGVDTVLFHPAVLSVYAALPAVAAVNVVACLLREGTKNTWPCIAFHVAYGAFYAFFVW